MRAILIPTDAPAYEIELKGGLAELQSLVGGDIESIPLMGGRAAFGYINADGKGKGLPLNNLATFLADIFSGDYIAGPMLVMGEADEGGDETDVPESTVDYIDRIAGVERMVQA